MDLIFAVIYIGIIHYTLKAFEKRNICRYNFLNFLVLFFTNILGAIFFLVWNLFDNQNKTNKQDE